MYTLRLDPIQFTVKLDDEEKNTVTNMNVSLLNDNGSIMFFKTAHINKNNQFEFNACDFGEYYKFINFLINNDYCKVRKIEVVNYPNYFKKYFLVLTENALLTAL